jgi:hypothetical protein
MECTLRFRNREPDTRNRPPICLLFEQMNNCIYRLGFWLCLLPLSTKSGDNDYSALLPATT